MTGSIGSRSCSGVIDLLIEVAAGGQSAVIGLVGPWGSGKTSTLNMIMAGLDRDRWGVSEINPWAHGDPDSVVADLLAAVSAALPPGKPAAMARQALARYGVFATPLLSVIPLVGSPLRACLQTLEPVVGSRRESRS